MQTEGLLTQSQQLAAELQAQKRELQETNDQLEQKAQQHRFASAYERLA
jgi:hypothetical protein